MHKVAFIFLWCGLLFHSCATKTQISGSTSEKDIVSNSVGRRAEVLFLGHNSKHHDSGKYAPWLAIKLFESGINLTYTTQLTDLNVENLSKYDGLIIYANHDTISSSQEIALKDFVSGGKGLIPLHCAAGCFKNSEWYIKAIGGQFKSHGTGKFIGSVINKDHPVMKGISEFETWDETYVHQNLNPDKTVLMERVEGDHIEPWTWVRNEGKGRVFYTAYGHNDSTWTSSGFLNLVRNGVLWALGDNVTDKIAKLDIPDASIYDDTISNYSARHLVPKIQEGLTPEQSIKMMQVPVDFEVKLFAAEPDITNPIAMNWDERGRLWVVESVDYPNTFVETDGAANDRIKICEDTNGDGKADKFTVFADSLNIPTSIVFANGGIIVSQAPHFVYMKDTNGDDKADIRQNIITGWGKNDTHAGPSNLMYGFDNKIWGVVGYAGFNGKVGYEDFRFGQGLYRFTADGKDLEYLAPSSNNTWGLGFSEDNNVFISTANNTHSAYYSIPAPLMQRVLPATSFQSLEKIDGHYDVHALTPNLRQVDVVGGFTSAAGHHLYTARNYPKEYWNRIAFICEPTVRLIHNAVIEPEGAGFKEKDGWNFLASSDEWVGPVQAQVGPDGAVWVADWYNFIIQHNTFVPGQAPTEVILPLTLADQKGGQGNALETKLRDLDRGRIYRIVYKKAKIINTPVKLSKDDNAGLLAALESDNMFWRLTAQRLLVESKNKASIPGLFKIINNQKVDEIGLNSPAVHALWTLHGFGALDGTNPEALQVVTKALRHPAAGVRKAAVEVLPKNNQTLEAIQKSNILNDANLNVRLNALLSLTTVPASEEIGSLVYKAALNPENTKDKWVKQALFAAAITHEKGYLATAKASPAEVSNSELRQQIIKGLNEEVYPIQRRTTMQFPPDVSGKEITFKASIIKRATRDLEGLIIAQGGKENGYGLYIQDGKINMVVNQNGKIFKAVTNKPLPEEFNLVAQLQKNGEMLILIDGKQAAKVKAPSLFTQPLNVTVRSGEDLDKDENRISAFENRFEFTGNLQDASLELKKAIMVSSQPNTTSKTTQTQTEQTSETAIVSISVVPDMMQFTKKLITVKAGQKVIIEFDNPDGMQHNLVISKPGTFAKVGAAADILARDPEGAKKNYVPKIPEVLFATKLVNSEESATLKFTAPTLPGDYPFICTFPGHWRGMNGILRIVK